MVSSEEHQEVLDRFRRYRTAALIGYVIALTGIGIAINGNATAIHDGKNRGAIVRGVLCKQLTEKDINLYKFVRENPSGSGGFSELLTPDIIKKSLATTARERREIGYSPRPPECVPTPTPESRIAPKDLPRVKGEKR